ncbi:Vinorine synthase-like [Quillaja saponaria]|uniref:Vinorine synthase-like n=1 Tax=Quillaja saponaria TaxID=32244 RepID=A0AAD7L4Y0_QUISA|nr:Vinorine synthase-like [Quillaja saponaria]
MKLAVELVSEQLVKPSSPTPESLRHYQLSFLDQISAEVYNPFVYLFPSNGYDLESNSNPITISNRLKKSLSEILTHYYPLAGRFIDNKFVHCNDEGVPFLETRIKCKLNDAVHSNLVGSELDKLVPFELDGAAEYPFGIQLNVFDCGGVAIGVCFSHQIADGLSCLVFIKRYDPDLIPTKEKDDDIISKRFVFSASVIETLKAKYRTNSESKKPISRVEALSTFIWSRFLAIINHGDKDQSESDEPKGLYALLHNVNLRSRMEPPVPEYSFGNYYREVVAMESEVMCHGFPLYDVNFGWGIPVWVGLSSLRYENQVLFADTESGGGIEASISLKEEDMAKFENDKELLASVSSIG